MRNVTQPKALTLIEGRKRSVIGSPGDNTAIARAVRAGAARARGRRNRAR